MPRVENSSPACTQCGCAAITAETECLCPVCLFDGLDLPGEPDEAGAGTAPGALRSLLPLRGYTVIAEIARGGMGVVYRARQWEPEREVALKMLLPLAAASREMRERFHREAQALCELDHPAILPVYGMGEHDGLPWFTMKLAAGGNLAERAASFRGRWGEIAALIATLADAVQFAHDRGVLHRDLKPGNILFDDTGRPFVADFGLAKLIDEDAELTHTRLALGTPSYLAPEVAASNARRATVASDVYSLGAVLFELLAGRPPFQAEGLPALLARIVSDEARFPENGAAPAVPRDLRVIALRCLAKDPARRCASARELAAELRRFLAGEPIVARPAGAAERAWRWARRNPALTGALAACVFITILGVAGIWRQLQHTEAARALAVQKTGAEHEQRLRAEAARRQAEQSELVMRQNLYAADMLGVQRALAQHDLGTARLLLDAHRPSQGQADLRGFEWRHFLAQAQPRNFKTLSHEGHEVSALAFSPDGAWLAYGSRQVMLHDTATFGLRHRIDVPSTASLGFVPGTGAPAMFIGNRMRDVHLWTGGTETPPIVLPVVGRWPEVAFTAASGQPMLAVGVGLNRAVRGEGTAFLHTFDNDRDLASGGRRRALPDSGGAVAFSPDGRSLATGSWQGNITLWEPVSATVAKILTGAGFVTLMRFAPDGKTLVVCNQGEGVWLYDVASGAKRPFARGHAGWVADAAISPDGRTLASGGVDQTLRLWDLATGRQTAIFLGHSYAVSRVAWSPDGTLLASGGLDGTVRLWRAGAAAEEEKPRAGRVRRQWFAPDGRRFVASHMNGHVSVYDFPGLARLAGPRLAGFPLGMAPEGEGGTLITMRKNAAGSLELARWGMPDLRPLGVSPLPGAGENAGYGALSPDGRKFAMGLGLGEVGLWDFAEAAPRFTRLRIDLPQATATLAVKFSPDGRRLAAAFMNSTSVYLWEIGAQPSYRALPPHKGYVTEIVFSPDGRTLISADGDRFIKVCDVETGRELGMLLGHRMGVASIDLAPDGRTLASVSSDGSLRLWNLATRREVARFEQPGLGPTVAFAPDGTGLLYELREKGFPSTGILRAPPPDNADAATTAPK